METMRKSVAECLGTFVLVFVACGVAILTYGSVVPTALAFGLVIVAMAYSIGQISGCHINPAVSLAMLIQKKLTVRDFCAYVIAQFIGAIAAAAVLYWIVTSANYNFETGIWATNAIFGTTAAGKYTAGGYIGSIITEIILTFIFVYVILAVTSHADNSKVAGIVIGLTLTLVHLIGINLTGTSVNPARSFGPALMTAIFGGGTTALAEVWVFIVAPLIGGALASIFFCFLHGKSDEEVSGTPIDSK